MESTVSMSHKNVRRIAVAGILSALTIALNFTPFGFIPIPFLQIQITTMHIPVIIAAMLEGPVIGGLVGLVFGLMSIYTATITPLPIAFAFLNPLVSVLPRVLIGIISYYVFKLFVNLFRGKHSAVSIGFGAALGTLTNSIGVLGMIYILYAQKWVEALGVKGKAPLVVIFGGTLINMIAEITAAILLSIPVVLAIQKLKRRA